MVKLQSKTGTGVSGDLPWGTRLCLFYRTPEELMDALGMFFRDGLMNNEYCLLIAAAPLGIDRAFTAFSKIIPDFDNYIARGQLGILPRSAWFLTRGVFDPAKCAANYNSRIKQTLKNGFTGLRVAAIMSWLEKKDWTAYLNFESAGDTSGQKIRCLCAFPLDKLVATEIFDVFNTKRKLLYKHDGQWTIIGQQPGDIPATLGKRIKELHCLYDIARISGMPDITLEERLAEIVKIMPEAFNKPEDICARIRVEKGEFRTANYRETKHNFKSDIYSNGGKSGFLEISYLDHPDAVPTIFKEEKYIAEAISERLGRLIEHRKAEDALKESEEKFSKAFHSNPAMVSITGLEDGYFLEVNDAFEHFTEYTREEAKKLTTIDIGAWSSPAERERMMHQLRNTGKIRDYPMSLRAKSGKTRYGLYAADLITVNGKPCVLSVTQDMTEQTHTRELVQSIYRSSPLGIYVVQDGIIQYVNPQLVEMTGKSSLELIGRNWLELVSQEDTDVIRSSIAYMLEKGTSYPCEYRLLTASGQAKWVMQTVVSTYYKGKSAMLGSIMDISERKYLERKVVEYEELDKLKSSLLSAVSHELRTPLASIKGYSTMIMDYAKKLTAAETAENVRTINTAADKLIRLVDNLLESSYVDAGLLQLEKAPADIVEVIKAAVNDAAARDKQHHFITKAESALPTISLDAHRIRRVLDNVIDNAIKYSPKGKDIVISACLEGAELAVAVTDQGPGIPKDELATVFERMSHIEKKAPSQRSGLGLGLHISQRLVEAHGGHIRAESVPGKGCTIRFTLSLNPQEKDGNKTPPAPAHSEDEATNA
jgi:PAS domain S-box-containing protein